MNQLVKLPRGLTLRPGQEYWEDNPYRLAARVRQESKRGRIIEVSRWEVLPGRHGAIVNRLRPRPTWRRTAALWASGGVVASTAAGIATWWIASHLAEILTFVGMTLLVAIGLAGFTRVLLGHRPTCTGLHCPGCRH